MEKRSNTIRLFLIINVFVLLRGVYAQELPLILKFHRVHEDYVQFPCFPIDNCIDSVYQHADTLYIILQDPRIFHIEKRGTFTVLTDYGYQKHNFKTQISIDYNQDDYNFLVLNTFDFLCLFKKQAKKKRQYKILSIKKVIDYSNKKAIDIEENDVIIRD
jgi:hypothetical protein